MTAAKGEITVQTDSVSREAFVSGNSIHLRTGAIPGATYAYYLTHKRGLEKQFYTNSTAASFHLPSLPGFYVATFFYKVGDAKASHKLVFVVDGESRLTIVHKREVATAAQYRIDYYDRGADTTFIVFNGSGSTLQSVPFGLNFLIAQGFNVLACLHNNDQYQGLSFEEFETHVKPVVQDKTVFLYGSSLGAYSALYYAGAVNGHVISAAPRNSAHPSVIARHGAASKYKPEGFKHKNYAENKLTDGRVYIVVDPHEDQDMAFLRDFVLDVYPRAEVIRFPYGLAPFLRTVCLTSQAAASNCMGLT